MDAGTKEPEERESSTYGMHLMSRSPFISKAYYDGYVDGRETARWYVNERYTPSRLATIRPRSSVVPSFVWIFFFPFKYILSYAKRAASVVKINLCLGLELLPTWSFEMENSAVFHNVQLEKARNK